MHQPTTVPVRVDFSVSWLASSKLPPARAAVLLRLVDAIAHGGSVKHAAHAVGVSYRHAWGLLGEAAEAFGAPVVQMRRGQGAQPTALGRKLLWADRLIRDTLDPQLLRLRHDVEAGLSKALPQRLPHLVVHGSHDLALAQLPSVCAERLDLELAFRGADECLADFASGKCDIAGFHVADALPRAAAAAASLGRWLDSRRHSLINFITREQGLIAAPEAHIRSVRDLTRPGVRFVNRQSGALEPGGRDESVAAVVADGRADAGFGLRADATRFRLDFVPLAIERYFLAVPRSEKRAPAVRTLIEALRSDLFAAQVRSLPGYQATRAGSQTDLASALKWIGHRRSE